MTPPGDAVTTWCSLSSHDGQDSGGQEGHQFDENKGDEDEGDTDHYGGRRVLSEEFVCHSDDAE